MLGKSIILSLAVSTLAHGEPAADPLSSAGVAEFSAAYQAWDAKRFGKAADYFQQASDRSPGSARPCAWRGAALFHQMLQLQSAGDPKGAEVPRDGAVAALTRALELNPKDPESHALLGTLIGMKINGSMIRAIRYGPSVQDHQKQAMANGPANPRVRYLLGTGQFHTASDDDDRREALATLLAAEKLFKEESAKPAGALDPRWGHSSCLTFIARCYESLGKKPEALAYFRKSLAEHPADHVAKDGVKRLEGAR